MTTINQDFQLYAGDDRVLSCSVVDSTGAAQSLVGITSLIWTLRTAPGATALLTKGIGTGITVTNAAGGLYTIALDTLNTATLSGRYYHKAVLTDSVADITTIMEGWVTIEPCRVYATLAQLKQQQSITDTTDDARLAAALETSSRAIDDYCGRRFYSATETRYYTARKLHSLTVDDLLSVTTLQTDDDADGTHETTWATTDYDLAPYNAATDGKPYWYIEVAHNGNYLFPFRIHRGVKIVGVFGFAATVPAPVTAACLIQATRLWFRKDSPLGVTGSVELGVLRLAALDPDVRQLLSPYRLLAVA
jgi:hypothetical protein